MNLTVKTPSSTSLASSISAQNSGTNNNNSENCASPLNSSSRNSISNEGNSNLISTDSKHLLQQQIHNAQNRAASAAAAAASAAAAAASVASTNGNMSPAASFDIGAFNMGHLHGFQVIYLIIFNLGERNLLSS